MDDKYTYALKALADPSRLRIFWLLAQINQKITVAEAIDVLDESQYNVSRNMKILQKAELLTATKDGKWVFYTLKNEDQPFYKQLMDAIRMIPHAQFQREIDRCKLRLTLRENGKCVLGAGTEMWKMTLKRN